jgi:hypothetical protein
MKPQTLDYHIDSQAFFVKNGIYTEGSPTYAHFMKCVKIATILDNYVTFPLNNCPTFAVQ